MAKPKPRPRPKPKPPSGATGPTGPTGPTPPTKSLIDGLIAGFSDIAKSIKDPLSLGLGSLATFLISESRKSKSPPGGDSGKSPGSVGGNSDKILGDINENIVVGFSTLSSHLGIIRTQLEKSSRILASEITKSGIGSPEMGPLLDVDRQQLSILQSILAANLKSVDIAKDEKLNNLDPGKKPNDWASALTKLTSTFLKYMAGGFKDIAKSLKDPLGSALASLFSWSVDKFTDFFLAKRAIKYAEKIFKTAGEGAEGAGAATKTAGTATRAAEEGAGAATKTAGTATRAATRAAGEGAGAASPGNSPLKYSADGGKNWKIGEIIEPGTATRAAEEGAGAAAKQLTAGTAVKTAVEGARGAEGALGGLAEGASVGSKVLRGAGRWVGPVGGAAVVGLEAWDAKKEYDKDGKPLKAIGKVAIAAGALAAAGQGAIAGATIGAVGGPVGMVIGSVIGGAVTFALVEFLGHEFLDTFLDKIDDVLAPIGTWFLKPFSWADEMYVPNKATESVSDYDKQHQQSGSPIKEPSPKTKDESTVKEPSPKTKDESTVKEPYNLQDELAYVSRTESGGNPRAINEKSAAAGLYQFIQDTAVGRTTKDGKFAPGVLQGLQSDLGDNFPKSLQGVLDSKRLRNQELADAMKTKPKNVSTYDHLKKLYPDSTPVKIAELSVEDQNLMEREFIKPLLKIKPEPNAHDLKMYGLNPANFTKALRSKDPENQVLANRRIEFDQNSDFKDIPHAMKGTITVGEYRNHLIARDLKAEAKLAKDQKSRGGGAATQAGVLKSKPPTQIAGSGTRSAADGGGGTNKTTLTNTTVESSMATLSDKNALDKITQPKPPQIFAPVINNTTIASGGGGGGDNSFGGISGIRNQESSFDRANWANMVSGLHHVS